MARRSGLHLGVWLAALALLAVAWTQGARPVSAAQDDAALAAALRGMVAQVDAIGAALDRGDVTAARATYKQFDDAWFDHEDGVRERSRPDYRAIEQAMDDVEFGLRPDSPDTPAVKAKLQTLRERVLTFTATLAAQPAAPAASAGGDASATLARDNLRPWAARIDTAVARLNAGDLSAAEADFEAFHAAWPDIEDDIRPVSRPHYREIERAMADAKAAFATRPMDRAGVAAALGRLQAVNAAFLAGAPLPEGDSAGASAAAIENATPATLIGLIDATLAALDRGDVAAARDQLRTFQEVWLDVEGLVMARSRSVYVSSENRTAEAAAMLNSTPPDVAGARAALTAMRADLVPVVEAGNRYGVWDAAIILFREGFEALLVIAALIAFLQRSGNADKRGWIWGGGLAGIAASVVVAAIAQLVMNRAAANVSRELIEGVTGLVAAAMLLYMGYWLHSKASLAAWQEYIREQSTAALKRNSLLGLASIAFLAVFREGAETVLFYVGIAPGISMSDLLLGLGLGTGALVVLAVLMLVVGVRIPVRPFFLVATLLIYYLCLKFAGTGVHSLQVAGVIPATPASYLPAWDFLGMYPTWETTLVQLLVLLVILAGTFAPRITLRRAPPAAPAPRV